MPVERPWNLLTLRDYERVAYWTSTIPLILDETYTKPSFYFR